MKETRAEQDGFMRELSRKYQRVRGYLALVDVMPREGANEMCSGADVACGVLGRMARRAYPRRNAATQ